MYKSFTAEEFRKQFILPSDYAVQGLLSYGAWDEDKHIKKIKRMLDELSIEYSYRKMDGFLSRILELKINDKKYWFVVMYGGALLSEYIHLASLFGSKKNIHIFNVPEADTSLYNFEQKGSYVAHGALIENIIIVALKYGYKISVKLFPIKEDLNLVATLIFDPTNPRELPSCKYISKRCTNRKDHAHKKISEEQKKQLIETARETGLGELKIIDDDESLNILGKALAVNEQIIFENKKLHNFFYSHIIWKEDEQSKAGGFYIKTLEFLPHQLKGVKLFKNWLILKILNKIGKVSRMIAKENAEKYANSGALAVVVAKGNSREDFVNAGRTAQKVWLKATELGLSVHPCTGVIYFMERINGGDADVFSQNHLEIIKTAYSDIARTFEVEGKTIPMLFRVGCADDPSARSLRMKPNILFAGDVK